jgi:hypothetical protein
MRLFMGIAIIAVCLILGLMDMITDYLTLLPVVVIVAALLLFPGEAAGEKKRRKTNLESARYMWDLWNRKWIAEAGDGAFFAQLNHLRMLKGKYEHIEREYHIALTSLERTAKERQQKKFLEHCSIDTCTLPRVTPGLKNILRAAGIRTAADILPNRLRGIPQLDNTLINSLLLWREKMEGNFLFDSTKGIDRSDIKPVIHKYQPMIKPVERDLLLGIPKLQRRQQDIIKKRVSLRPAVEKRARELAKAEADFEVFSRTPEELILKEIDGIILPLVSRR